MILRHCYKRLLEVPTLKICVKTFSREKFVSLQPQHSTACIDRGCRTWGLGASSSFSTGSTSQKQWIQFNFCVSELTAESSAWFMSVMLLWSSRTWGLLAAENGLVFLGYFALWWELQKSVLSTLAQSRVCLLIRRPELVLKGLKIS